jgi:hypothetical protein
VEQRKRIASFQLSKSLLMGDNEKRQREENKLSSSMRSALVKDHAILRTCPERLPPKDSNGLPIHLEIPKCLGRITRSVLEGFNGDVEELAVILTGGDTAMSLEIPKCLGRITRSVLEGFNGDVEELAVILTGGDTAMSVFNVLGVDGVEIEGEILDGIVMGHFIGGNWNGLTVITKAGAFGEKNAFEKIMHILETESP